MKSALDRRCRSATPHRVRQALFSGKNALYAQAPTCLLLHPNAPAEPEAPTQGPGVPRCDDLPAVLAGGLHLHRGGGPRPMAAPSHWGDRRPYTSGTPPSTQPDNNCRLRATRASCARQRPMFGPISAPVDWARPAPRLRPHGRLHLFSGQADVSYKRLRHGRPHRCHQRRTRFHHLHNGGQLGYLFAGAPVSPTSDHAARTPTVTRTDTVSLPKLFVLHPFSPITNTGTSETHADCTTGEWMRLRCLASPECVVACPVRGHQVECRSPISPTGYSGPGVFRYEVTSQRIMCRTETSFETDLAAGPWPGLRRFARTHNWSPATRLRAGAFRSRRNRLPPASARGGSRHRGATSSHPLDDYLSVAHQGSPLQPFPPTGCSSLPPAGAGPPPRTTPGTTPSGVPRDPGRGTTSRAPIRASTLPGTPDDGTSGAVIIAPRRPSPPIEPARREGPGLPSDRARLGAMSLPRFVVGYARAI